MNITGWGKYPDINANIIRPRTNGAVTELLTNRDDFVGIARGLGRSYGDSSLHSNVVDLTELDHFLDFDEHAGTLTCAAGVSLEAIVKYFLPRGWFLPVTPGTKFVTVGGAIASDVHGKNHHLVGSFGDHVLSLRLITAEGETVTCTPTQNTALFAATLGGMGLTGVIIDAVIRLIPVPSSQIEETTIKAANLTEVLALFEEHGASTYSVAWIDCLATGDKLGRSLLMLGEHADTGQFFPPKASALNVPCDMPAALLNRYSIQAFNTLYYHRAHKKLSRRLVHYEPFFYPLDGIHHWNRMYGKNGFTQYQFVLPKTAGREGMTTILNKIARSKRGSFLAVLKAFGKGNDNYLSFPMEGYTLALDFKLEPGLFPLLNELDRVVLDYGGRLYLTKDARMSETTFKKSYANWEKFMTVRTKHGADKVFNSLQSKRLGI